MNPNAVFSASLVTSLLLWLPSMLACLRGDLDLAPAGLRYLAALIVSRLAMGGLARLLNVYRAERDDRFPSKNGDSPVSFGS
jgi:Na+-driven multidrug efflux pump